MFKLLSKMYLDVTHNKYVKHVSYIRYVSAQGP